MKLTLLKTMGGLVGSGDESIEHVAKLKLGAIIEAEFKQVRNPAFHRKYFALLRLGFDAWEPAPTGGFELEKSFDAFREQVTILAGFGETVYSITGEGFTMRAKSISFAAMDEHEFEKLYSATIDVLLRTTLNRYASREEIDRVVEQVLRFA